MKSIVYHSFKDITSTSTLSDNKTGPDIGVVIVPINAGIIILVVIVIGKYYIIIVKYYICTY